ncbi:hypothetical protein HDZ31DRAFT_60439 [Schizophyllum fasciatum]
MFSGAAAEGPGLQLAQELRNVSARLDKLSDDLHATDERIAELRSLLEAHQSSALSVALRKLNSSLQRRFVELDQQRERARELEAERDEAWQHASAVAKELDDMCMKVEGSTPGSSRRSSRVMASPAEPVPYRWRNLDIRLAVTRFLPYPAYLVYCLFAGEE